MVTSQRPSFAREPLGRSVEQLCEVFWELEEELSLLKWTIDGVAIWPLLRMKLYFDIAQKMGLFSEPHPESKSQNPLRGITRLRSVLASLLPHRSARPGSLGPLRDSFQYVVLTGSRRVEGRDLASHALCTELGERALIIDTTRNPAPSKNVVGYRQLCQEFRSRYHATASASSEKSYELCETVRDGFLTRLGADIGDLREVCRKKIRNFTKEKQGFEALFAQAETRTLFAVNAYNRFSAVAGALTVGVNVVELQHGVTSRYHLGYSWPTSPDVPYTPNELWTYGQFWIDTTPLRRQTITRVIGAPYIQELARSNEGRREHNLIVFVSQGVIGQRLAVLAIETARRRPDLKIVFRLHPSETMAEYGHLRRSDVPANFSVSHKPKSIYALLARANVQVGVFSTTVLEGMSLGVRTMLVSLPGIEHMGPIIARGDAILVEGIEELIAKIDEVPLCRDPSYYYATPVTRLV